jgi:hypothetical protein
VCVDASTSSWLSCTVSVGGAERPTGRRKIRALLHRSGRQLGDTRLLQRSLVILKLERVTPIRALGAPVGSHARSLAIQLRSKKRTMEPLESSPAVEPAAGEGAGELLPSTPSEPVARVDAAHLLPAFKTDLERTLMKLPNVRLESLKTLSRIFQSILHSWSPPQNSADLVDAVRLYVKLLSSFRASQRVDEPRRSEMGLMTDTEITDWYVVSR